MPKIRLFSSPKRNALEKNQECEIKLTKKKENGWLNNKKKCVQKSLNNKS